MIKDKINIFFGGEEWYTEVEIIYELQNCTIKNAKGSSDKGKNYIR